MRVGQAEAARARSREAANRFLHAKFLNPALEDWCLRDSPMLRLVVP